MTPSFALVLHGVHYIKTMKFDIFIGDKSNLNCIFRLRNVLWKWNQFYEFI